MLGEWLAKMWHKWQDRKKQPRRVLPGGGVQVTSSTIAADLSTYFTPMDIAPGEYADISLCRNCFCMTKTIDGNCGKCHAEKPDAA